MNTNLNTFPINKVSLNIGSGMNTIRRWHREGIIKWEPERDSRGVRHYTLEQVEELRRIKAKMKTNRHAPTRTKIKTSTKKPKEALQ